MTKAYSKPDAQGWVKFCTHRWDPDITFWAKPRHRSNKKSRIAGRPNGRLEHYWCQFQVQRRNSITGEKKIIKPSLSKGCPYPQAPQLKRFHRIESREEVAVLRGTGTLSAEGWLDVPVHCIEGREKWQAVLMSKPCCVVIPQRHTHCFRYNSDNRGYGTRYSSFRCAEAQFELYGKGQPRVLASRICAFVWGNVGFKLGSLKTKIFKDFHDFAEHGQAPQPHDDTWTQLKGRKSVSESWNGQPL